MKACATSPSQIPPPPQAYICEDITYSDGGLTRGKSNYVTLLISPTFLRSFSHSESSSSTAFSKNISQHTHIYEVEWYLSGLPL